MRYYEFRINSSSAQIKETTKMNLKEYCYSNTIAAINDYMYQSMRNGVAFSIYREEAENTLMAIFFYDQRKENVFDAYNYIVEMLSEIIDRKRIQSTPSEITMYQFFDCFLEAKRRGYRLHMNTMIESNNFSSYDYYRKEPQAFHYDFKEKIILENNAKSCALYDQSFANELSNIELYANTNGYTGNMFHYIISARSAEVANDMTETLVQCLAKSNRISGRRMEIISDMEPNVYKINNHIEDIIENNYGGVIVFDLSEKLGSNPIDYQMTCKFIENLVKKYKNQCLFIFTYNIENPGFSYYLLPNLKKYVIPVMLREGAGNRKMAINYLKRLIKESEYSEFVGQASEFMKRFPGNKFSQTDVMKAFEQFESWCLNKNVLQAYNYNITEDFMLDRDSCTVSPYEKLNKMIGLQLVKEQIKNIVATDIVEKERKKCRGSSYESRTMHMIFGGNPGSAKTTVAKLFAGIAKEEGILKSGSIIECGGMDLDGISGTIAIKEAFMAAKGGVLFIDEAYSLKSDTAVTVLVQEMENHREDVIVILAGYSERMQAFMKINEGLKSRIPYWIDFPDYDANELTDIFKLMLEERGFAVEDDGVKEAHYIFEKVSRTDNFGNGRYARNLIDHALQKQSVRLLNIKGSADKIQKKELFFITKEDICMLEDGLKEERIAGTAQKELKDMIGLSKTKSVIEKATARFRLDKLCMDRGIVKDKVSLHMVFTGNPGTAKTTVARLFAEIMKDEKVLSSGVFVEVGRADLIGTHVGATAPLVKKRFKEAQGGILFIDEAYSLCDSYQDGFGDEAINTIVQEMENHREDVIVIFAGYPDRMKHFLDRNPGLLSRIAFHVEFEDYSTEELCDITTLMLAKKKMIITNQAMKKLRKVYEKARLQDDYGNGRFVRKTIEEAEMNIAKRLLRLDESEITSEMLTTIEEIDILNLEYKKPEKIKIGFAS